MAHEAHEYLEEFLHSIDTIHDDVRHVFTELHHKDVVFHGLRRDIAHMDIDAGVVSARRAFRAAQDVADDKIGDVERTRRLIDACYRRLCDDVARMTKARSAYCVSMPVGPLAPCGMAELRAVDACTHGTVESEHVARRKSAPKIEGPGSVHCASSAEAARPRKHRKKAPASGSTHEGENSGVAPEAELSREDADDKLYCFCQQVSFGAMVACDNENCEIEWFHLGCAGLQEVPVGAWFCSVCLANKAGGSTASTAPQRASDHKPKRHRT
ncbi:hypothetical protein SeMB42_g03977 [Synchytrium endobioticum]|uniref:Chromatin modification-related protein n=1 Tax=Synchytrium endobioticum TaxID=286115 RepID=A0A507CNN5_9FUNG|nr:hypothetical protein SeLEV6574_g06432 [Synchytrium endobioticum]TPX45491.1 hypothetical protein SeMB42_g03977 [Synchytrium endobioticum]